MIRSTKGTILVEAAVALVVVAGVAGIAGWKPLKVFDKGPPVEQVRKLEGEVAALQSALDEQRKLAEAARAAEEARKDGQVRYAQQMTKGASAALDKLAAPPPEVKVASDLLRRSEFALGLAIGDLPAPLRAEIILIVDQALSSVQAERDAAKAALEAKDRELQIITAERAQLAKEREEAAKEAARIAAEKETVQAKLTAKSNEVLDWSQRTFLKEKEAGSLSATVDRIIRTALWLGAAYLFIVFVLPGIVKHLRPGKLKNLLRDLSGYTTSPLLYHDAKHKIDDLKTSHSSSD